jgi:hypothetical protein
LKDTRVTKCLITVTALIVVVAATPVLSHLTMAQPFPIPLFVKVFNLAHCSTEPTCPEKDNMLTTVYLFSHKFRFPAGPCAPQDEHPCIGPIFTFHVSKLLTDEDLKVKAEQGTPPPPGWTLEATKVFYFAQPDLSTGEIKAYYAYPAYLWTFNNLTRGNMGSGAGGSANGGDANGGNGGNANGGDANSDTP